MGLCRELGLRSREAALLDCQKALTQAREQGVIDIERGTKGGRGKSTATSPSRVERLVPVSDTAMKALETAATLQSHKDNLVPEHQLCSVEQMQRCAEGLSVLTEPVKKQVSDEPDNSVIIPPDAEVQENLANHQPNVVPAEEVPAAATFYF